MSSETGGLRLASERRTVLRGENEEQTVRFSAYIVRNPKHREEVEGVLIASMPTANSASPKIKRIPLPRTVTNMIRKIRQKNAAFDE